MSRRNIILSVSVLLLLFGLSTWMAWRGPKPTWGDEAFTLRLATRSWFGYDIMDGHETGFYDEIYSDVHPPLYFAISKFVADFRHNDDEPGPLVRVTAYVIYTLLIALTIYLLFRRMEPFPFFWTSVLIVTSAHLALFGPMMRYYSLSGLGVVCATLLLVPGSDVNPDKAHRDTLYRSFGYAIAMLVAFGSSYITAIVLVPHIIYILRMAPEERAQFLWALLLFFILSLPLLHLLVVQVLMNGSGVTGGSISIFGVIARLAFIIYSFLLGEFIRPWQPAAIAGLICLIILGVTALKARNTNLGQLLWLTLAISIPLGAIALTKTDVGIEFSASRVLFLAPLFFMLLGLAPFAVKRGTIPHKICMVALFITVALNLISTWHFHNGTDYIQSTYIIPWGKIADDAVKNVKPQTEIIFDDDTLKYWLPRIDIVPYSNINDMVMPENLKSWDKLTRIIFVYSPRDLTAQHMLPHFLEILDQNYTLVSETPYLTEDATSIRWKSMLFRRDFEPVKKVLRVYDRR